MGVVIAAQCNGREGSLFNRFWGSSNDQFRRAWERTETKADKPVGNNQALLTPARASLWFTEGDEQLGDFFWSKRNTYCVILATCVPPCRHDEIDWSSLRRDLGTLLRSLLNKIKLTRCKCLVTANISVLIRNAFIYVNEICEKITDILFSVWLALQYLLFKNGVINQIWHLKSGNKTCKLFNLKIEVNFWKTAICHF